MVVYLFAHAFASARLTRLPFGHQDHTCVNHAGIGPDFQVFTGSVLLGRQNPPFFSVVFISASANRPPFCRTPVFEFPKKPVFHCGHTPRNHGAAKHRLTTPVVANHRLLPLFHRTCSKNSASFLQISMVFSGFRGAAHKSAPSRFVTLQKRDSPRTLPTSLGVLRPVVRPFGEKNPWNLTRVMPPQGSVEVSTPQSASSRLSCAHFFMERT